MERRGTVSPDATGSEKQRDFPLFSQQSTAGRQRGNSPTPTPRRGVWGVGEEISPMPGHCGCVWTVVAEDRVWRLFDLGDEAGRPWRRFRLVSLIVRPKMNFHLAFNGQRFAMGSDARKLAEHCPKAFAWATAAAHEAGCHGRS